jgi:carboxynorspermidine decarboxylase
VVERKFGHLFDRLEWINFGGGHHITRPGYQVEALIERLRAFRARHGLAVYLEPGEALAIHTGVLVAQVLDVLHTDRDQAILDVSATCHMPDTLEMPYRAEIFGAGAAGEKGHDYRLGGLTCLAGDVIGDYSFDAPPCRPSRCGTRAAVPAACCGASATPTSATASAEPASAGECGR